MREERGVVRPKTMVLGRMRIAWLPFRHARPRIIPAPWKAGI